MKIYIIDFLLLVFSRLLSLIPKSEKIIVFSSFPDFTDNAFAVYKYLHKERKDKYRLIWIFSKKESLLLYPDITAYYKFSLKGFYYYARAKYVFCTHGLYSFLTMHQGLKIVNLWHGMPMKTIGCLDAKNAGSYNTKADYLIATSPTFRKLMSQAFNDLEEERVFLVGQPRNDMLFEKTDFFDNRNIDLSKFKSVGLWLPTYRQSVIGDIRIDGHYNENGISFLSMDDLVYLNNFLSLNNALLIVKLHPMDVLQQVDFSKFDNLLIVKQIDFKEQLYPLLGAADYLLTDYSSVWIDYCILKRPIGFVMNDIDEYRNSRGLTIENLADKLPGKIIDSLHELCEFIINRPDFDDSNMDLYNTYCDNKSTNRLINILNL